MSAAEVLRISVSAAYEAAKNGTLPVPVIRVGGSLRVPRAKLLALLGQSPPVVDGSRREGEALQGHEASGRCS